MKTVIAVALVLGSSVVSLAQTHCEKNITSAVFQGTQVVSLWPDFAIKWVSKNKNKYPGICFSDAPNPQSHNYVLVFAPSQSVFNGFYPTVKTFVNTNSTPIYGNGTVMSSSGAMWNYTYNGTVETTTTTTVSQNVPYTDTAATLYVSAYDEHGKIVSERWKVVGGGRQGGDPSNTAGYNLGLKIHYAIAHSKERLLKASIEDVSHSVVSSYPAPVVINTGNPPVVLTSHPNSEPYHQLPTNSQAGTGSVVISSDVEGADIFVDEQFVGNTPSTLRLPAGPHAVRVVAQNRIPWSRQVDVLKDSNVNLKTTLLIAPTNSFSDNVSAMAQSADNPPTRREKTASTRLEATGASNLAAFTSADTTASLTVKKQRSNWSIREVNSSSVKPKLSVNSFPSGADVFVDSAGVGKTPCEIELSTGDHSLQVVLKGYQDQTRKISLRSAVELIVDVNMQDK